MYTKNAAQTTMTLRPAIQVAIKRREAVLWGVDRGVRGLYAEAKVAVESIPMLGHSDPPVGVNSRRRVQEQPKKRTCLLTAISASPKWALT